MSDKAPRGGLSLVFLGNTFDSESVFEQFRRAGRPCLLVEETPTHQFRITHAFPERPNISDMPWGPWKFHDRGIWSRLVFPIFYAIHIFRFALFLKSFRKKDITLESLYILYGHYALILPFIKKAGLIKRWVFVMGDWFATSNPTRIWSLLGNRAITPLIFRYCCTLADRVIYITREIRDAQRSFWGKEVSRSHVIYQPILISKVGTRLKSRVRPLSKNLLFLGNPLPESGLERLFPILRDHPRWKLVLIGPPSPLKESFIKEAARRVLVGQIEDRGFLDRSVIPGVAANCFCGINLLTGPVYSQFTLPAKIMDYLQFHLPVVCTQYVGPYHKVIANKKLGLVLPESLAGLHDILVNLANPGVNRVYRGRLAKHLKESQGTIYPEI